MLALSLVTRWPSLHQNSLWCHCTETYFVLHVPAREYNMYNFALFISNNTWGKWVIIQRKGPSPLLQSTQLYLPDNWQKSNIYYSNNGGVNYYVSTERIGRHSDALITTLMFSVVWPVKLLLDRFQWYNPYSMKLTLHSFIHMKMAV